MKNKSYYFSHDGNARLDIKIQYLCSDLGMEGYGIFWYLIEALFDAGGYLPLKMAKILAKQMNSTEPKVMAVISNYELFEIEDDEFFSKRLINHFEQRKLLSASGKRGANIKWNREANREAIGEANGEAIDTPMALKKKRKEKKGKEIKKEIINISEILPKNYVEAAQMQLYTFKKKKIEESIIQEIWQAFRLEKIPDLRNYHTEYDFYKHFINWIKTQKFEDGKQNRYDAFVELANRYDPPSGIQQENIGMLGLGDKSKT